MSNRVLPSSRLGQLIKKLRKKQVPERLLIKKWKIYTGDKVEVLSGKDKGKQGAVRSVLRKRNMLIVEGVNLVKKHIKATETKPGGVFLKEAPIHYSNVNLVDPELGRPTRIATRYLDDGSKVRVAKKSGQVIPKPAIHFERIRPEKDGDYDTSPDKALAFTFAGLGLEDININLSVTKSE